MCIRDRGEAFLEGGDLLWQDVGGDDDLFVGIVQRIEDVKEFLLRAFLARQKLNVVDEQDVCPARLLVKVLDDGVVVPRVLDGTYYLVCELFAGRVDDLLVRGLCQDMVCNTLEKVGLAQPDSAIDVERVVDVAWVARNGVGCREGKA